jgi:predicted nucleic-acid-binding protein
VKGLDTNVLVRYLTQDDAAQAAAASREIDGAAAAGDRFLVQPVVLCELVWVLESAYRMAKLDILRTLDAILATAQLEVADKDVAWQALGDYRKGRGDFADYLIGRANERAGAEVTLTFDRQLKGHAAFQVLR